MCNLFICDTKEDKSVKLTERNTEMTHSEKLR